MSYVPKERILTRSLDYVTLFADDIILQIKDGIARLVFYQEELYPDEDGKKLDKQAENINLKFEIRIKSLALTKLAKQITSLENFTKMGMDTAEKTIQDDKVLEAWVNYNQRVDDLTYDTGRRLTQDDKRERQSLRDLYESLVGRTSQAERRVKNGENSTDEKSN